MNIPPSPPLAQSKIMRWFGERLTAEADACRARAAARTHSAVDEYIMRLNERIY